MQIPMNTLCYLIKLASLFPSYVINSLFVALSIFATLSNFCRIIKLLPSCGFKLFFLGVYISLVISQGIPSCETFSRGASTIFFNSQTRRRIGFVMVATTQPNSALKWFIGNACFLRNGRQAKSFGMKLLAKSLTLSYSKSTKLWEVQIISLMPVLC